MRSGRELHADNTCCAPSYATTTLMGDERRGSRNQEAMMPDCKNASASSVVVAQAGTHDYDGYRPEPVLGPRGARTRGPV